MSHTAIMLSFDKLEFLLLEPFIPRMSFRFRMSLWLFLRHYFSLSGFQLSPQKRGQVRELAEFVGRRDEEDHSLGSEVEESDSLPPATEYPCIKPSA